MGWRFSPKGAELWARLGGNLENLPNPGQIAEIMAELWPNREFPEDVLEQVFMILISLAKDGLIEPIPIKEKKPE